MFVYTIKPLWSKKGMVQLALDRVCVCVYSDRTRMVEPNEYTHTRPKRTRTVKKTRG